MYKLIDTHCHPQLGAYDDDRDEVIRHALEQGIGMIAVGTTFEDSAVGIELVKKYPDKPMWATVGVHPTDETLAGIDISKLKDLVRQPKVVAIGETGLDYFHEDDPEALQLQSDIFEQHILLSLESQLPLIVHCRDLPGKFFAYDHVLALLKRHNVKKFVMHCYSGDWAHADQFLDLGGYLSFTGIVTFPKSETMQEVATKTPADRIMVETDSPFLAPAPFRGKRCEPAYVHYVAQKIAELRGMNITEFSTLTTTNANKFFGLEKAS